MKNDDDKIRLISKRRHIDPDEEEEGEEEYTEPERGYDQVLTKDEQVLRRLESLEELLRANTRSQSRNLPARRTGRDDFALTASDTTEDEQEEIVIRIQDQIKLLESDGSLNENVSRAFLSMLGASYGAQLGGPAWAGIGAAIGSLLHTKQKANPFDLLFPRRK